MRARASGLWVWEPYSTVRGQAFVTAIERLSSKANVALLTGERVRVKKLVITEMTGGRLTDNLGAYTSILIVSPVIRAVIEETPGANVQFIPVEVKGKRTLSYAVANVLDVAPAIDLAKSRVKLVEGTQVVQSIQKLVPRPPRDWPPLFHPAEVRDLVLVDEDTKARLTAASKHPGEFVRLEQYRQGR